MRLIKAAALNDLSVINELPAVWSDAYSLQLRMKLT